MQLKTAPDCPGHFSANHTRSRFQWHTEALVGSGRQINKQINRHVGKQKNRQAGKCKQIVKLVELTAGSRIHLFTIVNAFLILKMKEYAEGIYRAFAKGLVPLVKTECFDK